MHSQFHWPMVINPSYLELYKFLALTICQISDHQNPDLECVNIVTNQQQQFSPELPHWTHPIPDHILWSRIVIKSTDQKQSLPSSSSLWKQSGPWSPKPWFRMCNTWVTVCWWRRLSLLSNRSIKLALLTGGAAEPCVKQIPLSLDGEGEDDWEFERSTWGALLVFMLRLLCCSRSSEWEVTV